MWLFYAIGSAFFAGVTSILAKCGIRKDGFNRSDGSTDDCDPGLFLDHGVCSRFPESDLRDQRKDAPVSDALRSSYGCILALLL